MRKTAYLLRLAACLARARAVPGRDWDKAGALHNLRDRWNTTSAAMADHVTGTFRVWWSCGTPDGICYGTGTQSGWQYVNEPLIAGFGAALGICDLQDPTAIYFNGSYYLYASGIPAGTPGCPGLGNSGNEHASVYGFISSDGNSWSILNNGNPVIKISSDPKCYTCYTGHGNWTPSAIVMQSGRLIRVYYSQNTNGMEPPDGIYAMDSLDGTNFFSPRVILGQGQWEPVVKKVGITGDYPLVMTYVAGSPAWPWTATANGPDDTKWITGNGGKPVRLFPPSTFVSLEGDESGRLIDTKGAYFTGAAGGEIHVWWSSGLPAALYRGLAETARYFGF